MEPELTEPLLLDTVDVEPVLLKERLLSLPVERLTELLPVVRERELPELSGFTVADGF
jgi:hypothetical protein